MLCKVITVKCLIIQADRHTHIYLTLSVCPRAASLHLPRKVRSRVFLCLPEALKVTKDISAGLLVLYVVTQH